MDSKDITEVTVMAARHADFIRVLLEQQLDVAINLYELAFIHGFKHGTQLKGPNNEGKSQ